MKLKKLMTGALAFVTAVGAVGPVQAVTAGLGSTGVVAFAADVTELKHGTYIEDGDFEYYITGNKWDDTQGKYVSFNAEVTSYLGFDSKVVIPATVKGATVNEIGDNTFNGLDFIESITIPDGVTLLSGYMFSGCTALSDIILDGRNEKYVSENGVITNFKGDTLVIYPAGKTDSAYEIPKGISEIAGGAFNGNKWLCEVTLPGSLSAVKGYAFSSLSSLTKVNMPDVTQIYSNAFSYCQALESLTLSKDLKYLDGNAFANCENLSEIIVGEGNTKFKSVDGVVYTANGDEIVIYPCAKLDTKFTVPAEVKYIGKYAFYANTELEEIALPATLTSLGDNAFAYCTKLKTINVPDGITKLGDSVFYNCGKIEAMNIPAIADNFDWFERSSTALQTITVAADNTNYSSDNGVLYSKDKTILMFCPKGKIGTFTVPATTKEIASNAFNNCDNITRVIISDGVEKIGDYAFYDCDKLRSVVIPKTLDKEQLTSDNYIFGNGDKGYPPIDHVYFTGTEDEWKEIKAAYYWNTGIYIKDRELEVDEKGNTKYDDDGNEVYKYPIMHYSFDGKTFVEDQHTRTDHIYVPGAVVREPTCQEVGYREGVCAICGKKVRQDIPSLGHRFAAPTYSWTEDNNCFAMRDCKREGCTYSSTEKGIITPSDTVPATCAAEGSSVYTAKFNSYLFATQVNTVVLPKLDHTFGAATYAWADDHLTCTATRTCSVCNTPESETANTTHTGAEPTYFASGKTDYSVTFINPAFEAQTTTVEGAKLTLAQPEELTTSKAASTTITLKWNKVANAKGYVVEQKNGKKWKAVKTITKNSTTTYKVSKLKAATAYNFRVRAYVESGKTKAYSKYSTLTVVTPPTKLTGLKVSKTEKTAITLKWKKNKTATGYEVQQKNGSKWKKVKTISKNGTTTLKVSKLKKNTSYEFRVRAFKKSGSAKGYTEYVSVKGKTSK